MSVAPFGSTSVAHTDEVRRIAALPRRSWTPEEIEKLCDTMTRELKTPRGTMRMNAVQAIGLYEMMEAGGLFGPIFVGGGKTLLTLLCPLVLEAKRPILLLPASLIEKTWADRRLYAEHFYLPTNLQFISYESLSLVQNAKRLDYILPDLIVADELHYLANHRSGRGRRVGRYMKEHPETKFVGVSGTVMKKSITEFGRILRWALKDNAPVPKTDDELTTWAECLDNGVNPLVRRKPGAMMSLAGTKPGTPGTLEQAREVFQKRLLETRGVVASLNGDDVGCSILVRALEYKLSPLTEGHFQHVRKLWQTPDGWDFMQAVELRMYLRQLALGFHGIWRPRPPPEWLNPRKAWHSFARETLSHSHTLDTPLAVANAIDAGHLDDQGALDRWRAVEKTFTINPEPRWHDEAALEAATKWAATEKGIIWVEHRFFGQKLAKTLGTSYYGPEGLDANDKSIKDDKGGKAIIASVFACKQGFNLQGAFSTNLVTSCPSGSSILEQLIGRTHRPGQEADVVTVDIMLGCDAQMEAFDRAMDGAETAKGILGHPQKLLLADKTMPDISGRRGHLWGDDGKPCDCATCVGVDR